MRHGNGKPKGSKTSAADATPTEQRAPNAPDRPVDPTTIWSLSRGSASAAPGSLSCLSASVVELRGPRTDWVFLAGRRRGFGSARPPLAMTRFVGSLPRMHERLTDVMTRAHIGVVRRSAYRPQRGSIRRSLLLLGLIIGRCREPVLLQVIWGERFAAQNLFFSLACAPAAAVVTGLVLAMASDRQPHSPSSSLPVGVDRSCWLVLECQPIASIEWKTGLPEGQMEDEPQEADGGTAPQEGGEPPSRAGARCTATFASTPPPRSSCCPSWCSRSSSACSTPSPSVGDDPFATGRRADRRRSAWSSWAPCSSPSSFLRQGPHEHHRWSTGSRCR